MLTWGASTAVSKYTCWCYIYWQPCHFCSQDTVSEYPPLIIMPNFHCPQPCAIMILSFFSKSMSDTAITHITLKWSQYGHLVDGSEILPTSRGWLKYLIGPQPVFFYTESFWSINSSKATPVLPFPRGRTAPSPSPRWESSSWLVERIAKAVWVPRARNTASNGNPEVMVVDEVHKKTRRGCRC